MRYAQIQLTEGVLTEEKLDDIGAQLEASPEKSLHLLVFQYGLALCTPHIGTEFPKLQSYRTTVIRSALPSDCEVKL
jgi:hypothetical protein